MCCEKGENENLNESFPAIRSLAMEWHSAFTDHRVSGFHIRHVSPVWFVRIEPKGIHHG